MTLKGNDVPTVMARVETALARASRPRGPDASTVVYVQDMVADDIGISALRDPARLRVDFPSGSTRPYLGSAISFSKRALRRGMRWYSGPIAEQQTRFNQATLDLAERLHLENDRLAIEVGELRESLQGALSTLEGLEGDVHKLSAGGTKAEAETSELMPSVQSALDYRRFEDRHRGDVADVTGLLQPYVEYFRGCRRVIDVGCGRGEFLGLLRDAGIPSYGVDLDNGMVQACHERGLDAVVGNALEHLEELPAGEIDGVFCSQVAEHLTTTELVRLLHLAHRKLAPGGPVVLETPNPESLSIFASFFYVDLTHIKPIHPEAMVWALEATGFVNVHVDRVQPVPPSARLQELPGHLLDEPGWNVVAGNIERLNSMVYGPQHYAAVGRKGTEG